MLEFFVKTTATRAITAATKTDRKTIIFCMGKWF